jgi:hypothetical protein
VSVVARSRRDDSWLGGSDIRSLRDDPMDRARGESQYNSLPRPSHASDAIPVIFAQEHARPSL